MLVSGIKHCARFAAHLPQNVVMGRSMSTTLQYTSTRTRTLYKTPAAKANYLKLYTRDAPLWSGRALISTTRTQMMSNQDDKDVAQTAADKRNMGDARTLIQKSLAYSDRGDYVKALNELDAALENVVHLSPELPLISEIRKMMGLLLWDLDEFELCREQLEMYFNVSDKPGPIDWDKVKLAETPQHELTAIAQCYAELEPERYAEAMAPLELLYDIQVKDNDISGQAETSIRLGVLYHLVARHAAEEMEASTLPPSPNGDAWINKGLKNLQKVVDDNDMETAVGLAFMSAQIYEDINKEKACNLFHTVLDLVEHDAKTHLDEWSPEDMYDSKITKFQAYNGLANAYFHLGDFEKTEKNLNNSLKVIREVYPDEDYNLQAASVLQALASTYEHFNQNAIYTEGFYKNALSIFEHPDSVEDLFDNEDHSMQYLSCLKDFAGFMRSRGRIGDAEEAERKHKKHNEMYREHVRSRNLREQAEKLQQQQDIEAAKKHADKIRAMHDAKDEILADKQTQGK